MYTFELTSKYLTSEEQDIFADHLSLLGLDSSIWEVFASLFKSNVKNTKPLLLKVYNGSHLQGVSVVVKCRNYGKSLFNNRLLSGIINLAGIPFYLWVKFGCCMDMLSNPGFVKYPEKSEEVYKAMVSFLKENSILTIINDYTENRELYHSAEILPALPHALIDCTDMNSVQEYTSAFKNIGRKIKVFNKKGGEYVLLEGQLDKEQIVHVKKCFLNTTEKSVFYLPYQELYLEAALKTSSTSIKNVHYFIAMLNGEFLGYQAALVTGKFLNALHGAFDRSRKTTYHAYDILFVKMTEFAIQNRLEVVDFGAVLNFTKQRMLNRSVAMSYFVLSRYSVIQSLLSSFLKRTKIQGQGQMKFRTGSEMRA